MKVCGEWLRNRKECREVWSGTEHTESFHCNKNSVRLKRETIIQPAHRCSYMCLRFGWGRATVWPVHAGTCKLVQL